MHTISRRRGGEVACHCDIVVRCCSDVAVISRFIPFRDVAVVKLHHRHHRDVVKWYAPQCRRDAVKWYAQRCCCNIAVHTLLRRRIDIEMSQKACTTMLRYIQFRDGAVNAMSRNGMHHGAAATSRCIPLRDVTATSTPQLHGGDHK